MLIFTVSSTLAAGPAAGGGGGGSWCRDSDCQSVSMSPPLPPPSVRVLLTLYLTNL